jgi:predicted RNA-binding Zn ribbon-like protein
MSQKRDTAPGDLELVRQFVNSRELDPLHDELENPEDGAAWLSAHALPAVDTFEGDDLERLTAVREALRALLFANNTGEPPPADALAELNRQSAEAAIGLRFDPDGSDLVTQCEGVDSVIARLLAIVHGAMEEGTWPRLKACRAEDCVWAFYDHSRNRSGTWCSMEACGNRAKARAFRERRQAESAR